MLITISSCLRWPRQHQLLAWTMRTTDVSRWLFPAWRRSTEQWLRFSIDTSLDKWQHSSRITRWKEGYFEWHRVRSVWLVSMFHMVSHRFHRAVLVQSEWPNNLHQTESERVSRRFLTYHFPTRRERRKLILWETRLWQWLLTRGISLRSSSVSSVRQERDWSFGKRALSNLSIGVFLFLAS